MSVSASVQAVSPIEETGDVSRVPWHVAPAVADDP